MMHEEVHQGAGEQGQPNQQTKDVRSMFGEQERAGDDGKSDENHPCARCQKAGLRCFAFTM
jgi:hypothetical protein